MRLLADFAVHAGQHAVDEFDDGDLRTQTPPHRAEFEPDDAGTDHQQMLRHCVQRQRAGRRHHTLLVNRDALELGDVRAGGDDDRFGVERLRFAVVAFDFDLAGRRDAAGADEGIDLVFLEQKLDAFDVAVDALILEGHHGLQIELRRADANAHLAERVAGLFE